MKLTSPSRPDEEGAAYVEFLIAFLPFFILFLGMVQMSLMYAGDLVVQHAASRAARAAMVVLDDDPQYYDGAARRQVNGSGSEVFTMPLPRPTIVRVSGGPRLARIRLAAIMPLAAIAPGSGQRAGDDNVISAIGTPETRAAEQGYFYTDSAMAVIFPDRPGSTNYLTSFSPGQQVTTRVAYLFHCGVPMANRLMCESFTTLTFGPAAGAAEDIAGALRDGSMTLEEARAAYRRLEERRARQSRDRPGLDELENDAGGLFLMAGYPGGRFKLLRGESTMPLQSARYEY